MEQMVVDNDTKINAARNLLAGLKAAFDALPAAHRSAAIAVLREARAGQQRQVLANALHVSYEGKKAFCNRTPKGLRLAEREVAKISLLKTRHAT